MIAGQKSYGSNGKQNMLFPLEYMWLTQGEYSHTATHNGTYAMDFQGEGKNGRVYRCPYYAPFDCTVVAKWGKNSPMIVWQSDNEVNFVDGTSGYACIGFVHDDHTASIRVGDKRKQGQVIGHTGTYGKAYGDHVHIEVKKGKYSGYYQNSYGEFQLRNPNHLYDLIGVNNTVLVHDYYINHAGNRVNYPWREFSGVTPPTPQPTPTGEKTKKGYPWYVITSKKLHRM